MIQVSYEREQHRLTVQGHAQSAEKGKDLICAAVSILVFTLAQNIYELGDKGFLAEYVVRLDEGDAELACDGEYHRCYKLVFDTICTGLELLATDFPEHVTFIEK